MFVRMFKPQFAALVEAGVKRQTVRPVPKRMPKRGDTLSLRCWTGAPYRSKQRVLREVVVREVRDILIDGDGIFYAADSTRWAPRLGCVKADRFAKADGFVSWPKMREWFRETHGLPFVGIVIFW